jgi:hypothetical protein
MIDRTWRTSSYSGGEANDCVELAVDVEETAVRDSKDRLGGHLTFSRLAFEAFLSDPKLTRG